jgi:hypothetical protein
MLFVVSETDKSWCTCMHHGFSPPWFRLKFCFTVIYYALFSFICFVVSPHICKCLCELILYLFGCYFLVDLLICMYKFVLVSVPLTASLSFVQVSGSISLLMVSTSFKTLHLKKRLICCFFPLLSWSKQIWLLEFGICLDFAQVHFDVVTVIF